MSNSAAYHPSLLNGGSREGWRTQPRLLDIQSELDRTREELATLRATTAQVISAILGELQSRPAPFPTEIQKLADLCEEPLPPAADDPLTADAEEIDAHLESLEHLDRRFRWLPAAKQRAS